MVDIYLFRHAHVDYTPPIAITEHNPLTEVGHQMAASLAERCDEWDLQHLFVSTMLRAQQTADAISTRFPRLPRTDMVEFEETSLRDLEGYPGAAPPEDLRYWAAPHFGYANPRLWDRVQRGYRRVLQVVEEHALERVAIVSHGGPINLLLRCFLGYDDPNIDTCWFEVDWASSHCLRYTPTRRSIRWVNDARHIDGFRHLVEPFFSLDK
jgi:broad specificity phosphatase PhoE